MDQLLWVSGPGILELGGDKACSRDRGLGAVGSKTFPCIAWTWKWTRKGTGLLCYLLHTNSPVPTASFTKQSLSQALTTFSPPHLPMKRLVPAMTPKHWTQSRGRGGAGRATELPHAHAPCPEEVVSGETREPLPRTPQGHPLPWERRGAMQPRPRRCEEGAPRWGEPALPSGWRRGARARAGCPEEGRRSAPVNREPALHAPASAAPPAGESQRRSRCTCPRARHPGWAGQPRTSPRLRGPQGQQPLQQPASQRRPEPPSPPTASSRSLPRGRLPQRPPAHPSCSSLLRGDKAGMTVRETEALWEAPTPDSVINFQQAAATTAPGIPRRAGACRGGREV